jgi:transposase
VNNVMNTAEIIENQDKIIQTLKAELGTYHKRCEQYMQAYDQLQHQLRELLRNRFGKKSERFIDPENPQASLFGEGDKFSIEDIAGEAIPENEIQISAHSRKKNVKAEKDLPRTIEIIPLSEKDKICSCGACKEVISYETKESLHHHPAVFEIIEQRREVAVCPNGCEGSMITAPVPLHILPKVKATAEFLSFLVVSKLDDRQPLYHLEKQLRERHGLDCSRQNMARWVIDLMAPMQPLYNLSKDQVIEYDVSACDATTLQVLNEPGRKAKSYM